jgi:hypothetical protein
MIGRRPAHGCCPIIALRWMLAMTRLKYILALFVAVSWFASGFLTYLATTVAAWIPWIPGLLDSIIFRFLERLISAALEGGRDCFDRAGVSHFFLR